MGPVCRVRKPVIGLEGAIPDSEPGKSYFSEEKKVHTTSKKAKLDWKIKWYLVYLQYFILASLLFGTWYMRKCNCLAPEDSPQSHLVWRRFDFKSFFGQPLSCLWDGKQRSNYAITFFSSSRSLPHSFCFGYMHTQTYKFCLGPKA